MTEQLTIAKDDDGRPYALVREVEPGDYVIPDGGFTCMKEGTHKKVKRRGPDGDLYVSCACEGGHGLDGQISSMYGKRRCQAYYVGLYYYMREIVPPSKGSKMVKPAPIRHLPVIVHVGAKSFELDSDFKHGDLFLKYEPEFGWQLRRMKPDGTSTFEASQNSSVDFWIEIDGKVICDSKGKFSRGLEEDAAYRQRIQWNMATEFWNKYQKLIMASDKELDALGESIGMVRARWL